MKLVSWNIAYGYGPGSEAHVYEPRPRAWFERALEAMAEKLASEDPDVVCLQEVDFASARSGFVDQGEWLRRRLGAFHGLSVISWQCRYLPYPPWPPRRHMGSLCSGGVVLSRHPLTEKSQLLFPKPASLPLWYRYFYMHRYAQAVRVELPSRPLTVVNVHLEDQDVAARIEQIARLRALVEELRRQGESVVVAGDFNTVDGLGSSEKRMPDSREELRGMPLRAVFPGRATFPSAEPVADLDGAFVSPDWQVEDARVETWEGLSDHCALVADLARP